MHCSNNHLRICKFIEERGEVRKPHDSQQFHIVVESCSQRRYYILNKSNCFCVELDHLCNETFCIYEEDGDEEYEVQYVVDGNECQEACVNFKNQDFHHIKIINAKKCRTGTLCIKKRVYDVCGKEVHSDECFKIKVRGREFEKEVVLNRHNHFKACIEDLPFGSYEVKEKRNEDYDVTYIVNGVEKERGIISVEAGMNTVEVHNRMNNGTHILRICKWIMRNGKLVKPDYSKSYTITLRDHYAYKEYTLNCENHFCVCVEGGKNDTYVLEELDSKHVIYEVDGERVDRVEVTLNADHDVRVINVDRPRPPVPPCPPIPPRPPVPPCPREGELVIRKWIEEDGRLYVPNADQSFAFTINGYSEDTFVLDCSNDFTMRFDDMEQGYYHIYEENTCGNNVVFEVNGERQEDGYIFVESGEVTNVNMINQAVVPPVSHMIHIVKRINSPCVEEDIMPPCEGVFTILVQINGQERYYDLTQENNYEIYLPVERGRYVIYEVDPTQKVTYRLNGEDCFNEVVFKAKNQSYEVVVINYISKVNFVI